MGKHSKTNEKEIKRKKIKKKRHIGRNIFLILLVICIFAGIKFAKKVNDLDGNWLAVILGHDKETLKNLNRLDILIMGESTGMSDTIIACSYNPKTQKASMLSIPRDTYVTNGNYKYSAENKINSLFSGGSTPEKTVKAVNELTGLNIKYYILVDTEALTKLVDTIGGVEFDVPINMKYNDYGQNLHIDLKKGLQTLNGNQAEQVVRFRHNDDGTTYPYDYGGEDYGRMKTQRNLIIAVAKQTIKFKNITEIKNIINIMQEEVKTNIDFNLIKDYVPYAINMNMDEIQTAQLPGESELKYGGWFFFHDEEETKEVVNELFGSIDKEDIEEVNNVTE